MKLNYFYWVASLALFMAGCTTNEEGEDNGPQGSKKEAYTSVTIKLPALNGTKAAPSYNNGKKEEYKVNDLTLLFFRTANGEDASRVNEDDFVLSEAVSTIPSLNTAGGSLSVTLPINADANSVESITQAFRTGPISISENSVRVLALLNMTETLDVAKMLIKVGSPFKVINSALSLPQAGVKALVGKNADAFLMTSAPIYNNNNMQTLSVCVPKQSKDDAISNPVNINVERVVAKVQLAANTTNYTADGENGDGKKYFTIGEGSNHAGDKITILGWALGNTNTVAYPSRKVDSNWPSGLSTLWGSAMESNGRIHWALDPNYNQSTWEIGTFATPDNIKDKSDWEQSVEYCLENTCDYNYMFKPQVTRLIVKAKYIPNLKNQAGGNNTKDEDDTWWSFTTVAAHYSAENMYIELIKSVKSLLPDDVTDVPDDPTDVSSINLGNDKLSATVTSGGWEVALATDNNTPLHYKLSSVKYTPKNGSGKITVSADIISSFNSGKGLIQKYDKGVCYYDIFIRHFTNAEGGYGDDWQNESGYTSAQLGRYGVVRNNWYTVTVNSISNPGEPNIPIEPELPVDTQTAYIDCSIAISAWAKRDHDIDL